MTKAPALLLLSLALAGCAVAPQAQLSADPGFRPARFAWDGAGEDPNQARSAQRRSVATRLSSDHDVQPNATSGLEAAQDDRVSRALVICRGCLPAQSQPEDTRLAKAAD